MKKKSDSLIHCFRGSSKSSLLETRSSIALTQDVTEFSLSDRLAADSNRVTCSNEHGLTSVYKQTDASDFTEYISRT